jgi:hypothetical protein
MGTPSGNPSFGPLFTGDSPVRLTPQPGIPGRGALLAGVRAPLVFSGKVRAGGAGARRAHIGAPQGVAPSTLCAGHPRYTRFCPQRPQRKKRGFPRTHAGSAAGGEESPWSALRPHTGGVSLPCTGQGCKTSPGRRETAVRSGVLGGAELAAPR